jgi:hypothetical protein
MARRLTRRRSLSAAQIQQIFARRATRIAPHWGQK